MKCFLRWTGQVGAGNTYADWVKSEHERYRQEAIGTLIRSLPEVEVIAVRHHEPLAAGVRSLDELLAGYADAVMPEVEVLPEDDATILYTSGSTGHPKGAVSCQRNIISALLSWELDARAGK